MSGFRPTDVQCAGSLCYLNAVFLIPIEYVAGPVCSDQIPPDARVPRIATHSDAVLRILDYRIAAVANRGVADFRIRCAADGNAITQVWIHHATGHETDAVADNPVARGGHALDTNPVAPVPADDVAFARAAADQVAGAAGNPDAVRASLHQGAVRADPASRNHVFVSGDFHLLLGKTVQIQAFHDALTRKQLQSPAAVGKPRPQNGGAIPLNRHLIAGKRRQLGCQGNHVGRAEVDGVRAHRGVCIEQRLPERPRSGVGVVRYRECIGPGARNRKDHSHGGQQGQPHPPQTKSAVRQEGLALCFEMTGHG